MQGRQRGAVGFLPARQIERASRGRRFQHQVA
jgi:hypothetical protein